MSWIAPFPTTFIKLFEDEYVTAIQEREYYNPRKFKNNEQLVVGDVLLVKEDDLQRMSWKKGRIINVIKGSDKLVRWAEIKVRQHNLGKMLTLKWPLKYLVPFEIMDAGKRVIENNDVIVDITPVEIPPARRIRQTAAMNTNLLWRLNDTDDGIDEWAWWQNVTKGSV